MALAKAELAAAREARAQSFRDADEARLDDLDTGRFAAVAIDDLRDFIDRLSPRLVQAPSGQ